MRPTTIVNQPPISLIIPANSSASDPEQKLARVIKATRQSLQPTIDHKNNVQQVRLHQFLKVREDAALRCTQAVLSLCTQYTEFCQKTIAVVDIPNRISTSEELKHYLNTIARKVGCDGHWCVEKTKRGYRLYTVEPFAAPSKGTQPSLTDRHEELFSTTTSSLIDWIKGLGHDLEEDEPLFATTLSAFGDFRNVYQFSSAHLATLNRFDIIADHHGCTLHDIAHVERSKPLSRGQKFKFNVDWVAVEKERAAYCVFKKAQRQLEREEKHQAREAEWQRELATWPAFVPRNTINATHVVVRDSEWLKQQPTFLSYNPTTCKHNIKVDDCQVCSPLPLDYLANKVICFHRNLRSFTFSTGETVKMCPDCDTFDARRTGILTTVPKLADATMQHTVQRWEERLEAKGLPKELPDNPIVSFVPSMKMDKIEHAQAGDIGKASSAKNNYRASQIRKQVKTNTEATRKCLGCGGSFVPTRKGQLYHSDNCRKQHHKQMKRRRNGDSRV